MFKYMREKKEGAELKVVTFWVGDWSLTYSGIIFEPYWLDGRKSKVVCSVEGKSEGMAWCDGGSKWRYWEEGFGVDEGILALNRASP